MAYLQESNWDRLFRLEGGYVNDPLDPGGETKWGISKRSYPHLDIKNLTKNEAKEIYKKDFFEKPGFYKLPSPLAEQVMDIGINQGQTRAVKMLQIILGVKVDGKLGPITLKTVSRWNIIELNNRLVDARKIVYKNLVKNRPSSAKFLKGWLKRAEEFRV